MDKPIILAGLLAGAAANTVLAKGVDRPNWLNLGTDHAATKTILRALDELFLTVDHGSIDGKQISTRHAQLTIAMLELIRPAKEKDDDREPPVPRRQLINFYPLSATDHMLTIAQYREPTQPEDGQPAIQAILNLIARQSDDQVGFAIPLDHSTRHWRSKTVGRIRYHYRDSLNLRRAQQFDEKNTAIAGKLGLPPESFDFYMCENYQEIVALLGFDYDMESNGRTRDGYGVLGGVIFSIMNNEDFSHDVFHYYSGKINDAVDRNLIAEEGTAYSWGNAYYTDKDGEMIGQVTLVAALDRYLEQHPQVSVLELFEGDTKLFADLAPEVSTRSAISGVICDEVERAKGMSALLQLINSGRTPAAERFLDATERLIGIDRANFDVKVRALIADLE